MLGISFPFEFYLLAFRLVACTVACSFNECTLVTKYAAKRPLMIVIISMLMLI